MAAKNKQSKSKQLREIFYRKGDPVTQVSAPSVYGAKMLEKAGYEYAFLGGDVTFGTMLGIPGTYMTLTEKTFIGRYFVRSVDIPVVMDCDEVCGRGPAFHEIAVEEYINISLAGMDIDDRVLPEGRGAGRVEREHYIDWGVIPAADMVENIEAAAAVRDSMDPDYVIRVRCYDFHGPELSRAELPLEKTIERLQAYAAAGADVLYLGGAGVLTQEEIRQCVDALEVPCTVPAVWMTYELAKDLGLCEFRQPYELEMAMHASGWEFLQDFKKRGLDAKMDLRERYKGNPYMATADQLRSGPTAI